MVDEGGRTVDALDGDDDDHCRRASVGPRQLLARSSSTTMSRARSSCTRRSSIGGPPALTPGRGRTRQTSTASRSAATCAGDLALGSLTFEAVDGVPLGPKVPLLADGRKD
jgi:hypothetical protein